MESLIIMIQRTEKFLEIILATYGKLLNYKLISISIVYNRYRSANENYNFLFVKPF